MGKEKKNFGGHKFKDFHKVLTAMTHWLIIPAMNIYQQGTKELNPWYNKLSCGEDYVEKLWDGRTIKSELFLLKLKNKEPEIHPA